MKILILDTNERLNIDKNTETHSELAKKFKEEVDELVIALQGNDIERITSEAFDVLQLSIGLIYKNCTNEKELDKQNNLHNMKLIGRSWEIKKELEVREI